MTDAHHRFLTDQMAAAVAETRARIRSAPAITLTDQHVTAAVLANRLTALLGDGQLPACDHSPTTVPIRTTWSPGATTLMCHLDLIAFLATNHSRACDVCSTPSGGDLHQALVGIGPVGILAVVCGPCRRRRARSGRAVDLERAGRIVADLLLARLEAAG